MAKLLKRKYLQPGSSLKGQVGMKPILKTRVPGPPLNQQAQNQIAKITVNLPE